MMDSEVSVLLHCAAWKGLLESQVQVELSECYNRKTNTILECEIEEVWMERVSKEPWLFNGSKFRLHSFLLASPTSASVPSPSVSPVHPPCTPTPHLSIFDPTEEQDRELDDRNGIEEDFCGRDPLQDCPHNNLDQTNRHKTDDEESEPLLTLRLGLTCYKDYLGTNWSRRAAELCRQGEAEFGDPLALLAQPLGVGAVLCTSDSQVVLIRRSQKVAEAGGLLDIPGGHPEPKVVCEHLGLMVGEEHISVDMMQQKHVVSELFSSVCAEIRDEVNIPLNTLGEPLLMGVALNHTSARRPSAEFYVSCSLTSDDVRKLYWKGGAEANESTDIVFLSRQDVLRLNKRSPLWAELCPSAKGAMLLYQAVKPDSRSRRHNTHHRTDPDESVHTQ